MEIKLIVMTTSFLVGLVIGQILIKIMFGGRK